MFFNYTVMCLVIFKTQIIKCMDVEDKNDETKQSIISTVLVNTGGVNRINPEIAESVEDSNTTQVISSSDEYISATQDLNSSVEDSNTTRDFNSSVEDSNSTQDFNSSAEDSNTTQYFESSNPTEMFFRKAIKQFVDNPVLMAEKNFEEFIKITEIFFRCFLYLAKINNCNKIKKGLTDDEKTIELFKIFERKKYLTTSNISEPLFIKRKEELVNNFKNVVIIAKDFVKNVFKDMNSNLESDKFSFIKSMVLIKNKSMELSELKSMELSELKSTKVEKSIELLELELNFETYGDLCELIDKKKSPKQDILKNVIYWNYIDVMEHIFELVFMLQECFSDKMLDQISIMHLLLLDKKFDQINFIKELVDNNKLDDIYIIGIMILELEHLKFKRFTKMLQNSEKSMDEKFKTIENYRNYIGTKQNYLYKFFNYTKKVLNQQKNMNLLFNRFTPRKMEFLRLLTYFEMRDNLENADLNNHLYDILSRDCKIYNFFYDSEIGIIANIYNFINVMTNKFKRMIFNTL